jgi:nicotinic acid mononucleotide adenylyltransferase
MNLAKINRDPYYAKLYKEYDYNYIELAGYFDDSVSDEKIFDYPFDFTIPVNSITERIFDVQNPAVIITTGSFCPIHDGHVEMMEKAKSALEEEGYDVLAGYISPDHDDYIIEKNGDEAILAYERIKLINEKCKEIDWLYADPSSSIFSKGSINFTEVIEHLDQYLKRTFPRPIKVFYVCGGDNARFARTFEFKGNCVVISRPGYEDHYQTTMEHLEDLDNIIWADNDNSMSSTAYRSVIKHQKAEKKTLSIRIEEKDDREEFLLNIMLDRYNSINLTRTSDQKSIYYKLAEANNLVSLDSICDDRSFSLQISRHYDLFGCNFIRYGNRPGSDDLRKQAMDIPKGDYVIIDDDIHTGGTMRFAKKIMEESEHSVDAVMALMMSVKGEEILDTRDFFIGGDNNGLVIQLPKGRKLTRAPYIYPYVCPFARASILDPIQFSIDVWQMNYEYFKFKGSKLSEHSGVMDLFTSIGFTLDSDMAEICEYHVKLLKSLNQNVSS